MGDWSGGNDNISTFSEIASIVFGAQMTFSAKDPAATPWIEQLGTFGWEDSNKGRPWNWDDITKGWPGNNQFVMYRKLRNSFIVLHGQISYLSKSGDRSPFDKLSTFTSESGAALANKSQLDATTFATASQTFANVESWLADIKSRLDEKAKNPGGFHGAAADAYKKYVEGMHTQVTDLEAHMTKPIAWSNSLAKAKIATDNFLTAMWRALDSFKTDYRANVTAMIYQVLADIQSAIDHDNYYGDAEYSDTVGVWDMKVHIADTVNTYNMAYTEEGLAKINRDLQATYLQAVNILDGAAYDAFRTFQDEIRYARLQMPTFIPAGDQTGGGADGTGDGTGDGTDKSKLDPNGGDKDGADNQKKKAGSDINGLKNQLGKGSGSNDQNESGFGGGITGSGNDTGGSSSSYGGSDTGAFSGTGSQAYTDSGSGFDDSSSSDSGGSIEVPDTSSGYGGGITLPGGVSGSDDENGGSQSGSYTSGDFDDFNDLEPDPADIGNGAAPVDSGYLDPTPTGSNAAAPNESGLVGGGSPDEVLQEPQSTFDPSVGGADAPNSGVAVGQLANGAAGALNAEGLPAQSATAASIGGLGDSQIAGTATRGVLNSAATGAGGGFPPMMPPTGGMGQQEKERQRTTWLDEEEEVWGTDPDIGPAVIGLEEIGVGADDESRGHGRRVDTPASPFTRTRGPGGGRATGRG